MSRRVLPPESRTRRASQGVDIVLVAGCLLCLTACASQQVTSAPSMGARSEVIIEFNDVPAEYQRLAKIIWRSVALGEQCYDSLLPSLEEMRVRISQDPMSDFDSGFGLYPRMRRTPVRPAEVRARLVGDLEAQIALCRHFLADADFPHDVAIECRWVTYGSSEMGYLEFSCDEKRVCFEPVFLRYGGALRIESIMPLARIRVAPEDCSVAIAFTPLSLGQVFSGRMRVPLPGHGQMPSFLWVFRFNTSECESLIERMPAVISNAVVKLERRYKQFQPHLPRLAVDQSAVDVAGTEAVMQWVEICGQLGITMDLKESRLECLRCYTCTPAPLTQPSGNQSGG